MATQGKPNDPGCWFEVLAIKTAGAVLASPRKQLREQAGGQARQHGRRARETSRSRYGVGKGPRTQPPPPSMGMLPRDPEMLHPPSRTPTGLPKVDNRGHSRAPRSVPAFWGPTAADVPGCSAVQPYAPAEPCAPHASPGPSKAVTKPSLPAHFQAWRGPERRRHDPGGCPRKTRRPRDGSAPPRPPGCPGRARVGSTRRPAPRLGSAHSERKTSQNKRSGHPCLVGAPRRELF